ncbi:MAG TPA: AAA family ATPase [Actinophytocola sp.]|uniref:ATP-binding protein n=1 Tax=Actinophytocola sp. TaxID=1872138 RepID=UPI002DDC9BF6|nr:AAA family ATPase [Actinophytocola sp.]HEV2777857.1 AAA family ATPase [Actinophytocola sp.]
MTGALIGRDHPAGILRAEIGRAVDSHGGLVLVTGEPGIGKTALVTGAAEDARKLGALVLHGSCWDSDSAPGYWPWVQVVRGLRRAVPAEDYAAAERAAGPGLAALLGESPAAEATEGFPLYDAVTTALVSVSHARPVVVVLDDLHWADSASIALLEFAAQHTWFERLLLIGTYRDVEVESAGHPLRSLIVPLQAKATTVTLTGLDRADVGALMARTVGREPDADLVTEVHRRTGGNPFFVEQTARLWHTGGSITAIAPGVRDALRRRISLLPAPVTELLTTAAVLGREFHRQVLAAAAAAPVPQVDRLLDEAQAARLVLPLGAGRFAFAHDLVRETLYDSLDKPDARRRHAAVVHAIDRSPALADLVVPGDLANHAYLAGPEVEPARAVDHLLAAARDATHRLADEEAITHHRRAYHLAETPRRRVKVGLDLARTCYHQARRDEAWRLFEEVVAVARDLDDPELLARVALTLYGWIDEAAQRRPFVADLVRQVHTRLVGAAEPDASPDRLAQELAVRVATLARTGDDAETLGFSLWARHDAMWGPGTAAEREALTDELITVARRTSDYQMELFASSFRWVALVEQGDPRYRDQFDQLVALANRNGMPLSTMAASIDRSIIATLTGQFAEAEALLDAAASFEETNPSFTQMELHIRWSLRLLQGRYEDLDDLHRALAGSGHRHARLLEAISAVRRGNLELPVRLLAERGSGPSDRAFLSLWLRLRAEVAAATRDPALCDRTRADLAPYAGEWVVSLYGCDISGPMSLWLGLIDAARERWDEAVSGLTAAYRSADLLGARPWSVEARFHLARVLLTRGASPGSLLEEVERDAGALGMRHILHGLRDLRAESTAANEFRRTGSVWTLTMAGRTVHVPDAKGLRDLHVLLGRPGRDVPAVELLDPSGGELVVAARRLGGDAVLDDTARAAYRRRLSTLDEEIDRAAELGDDGRAAELDRERQALLDELRAAVGLAGRSRRLGDETERARKTVTARIRDALRKLDDQHPELAAHLRDSVSTGVTCRYDGTVAWRR